MIAAWAGFIPGVADVKALTAEKLVAVLACLKFPYDALTNRTNKVFSWLSDRVLLIQLDNDRLVLYRYVP